MFGYDSHVSHTHNPWSPQTCTCHVWKSQTLLSGLTILHHTTKSRIQERTGSPSLLAVYYAHASLFLIPAGRVFLFPHTNATMFSYLHVFTRRMSFFDRQPQIDHDPHFA